LNLLIFEFATAGGAEDPLLTVEGHEMLQSLTRDLGNYSSKCSVSYLISKHAEPIDEGRCQSIVIDEHPHQWIKNNIAAYDFCLPIAPEEDFILYELTRLIETEGVKVIGSNLDAVLTCSDKYQTYQALKNHLPMIDTHKVYWDEVGNYSNYFPGRKVVKPADGVSCSAVQIVESFEEFQRASQKIKEVSSFPYFILQEWVEGESASVSLLSNGKTAIPLSLNQQKVNLKDGQMDYQGGKVPFNHPLEEEAKEMAKKGVESINGLKGYVGVDLILGEEVHLVEINSRITTPYVALCSMLNFNLGQAILESVQGKLPSHVELKGEISFQKKGNRLHLMVIQ
jgi:predicted ATP-grasp superfamily ATP-dependent carboligase